MRAKASARASGPQTSDAQLPRDAFLVLSHRTRFILAETAPTQTEWSSKLKEAQAAGTRAAKLELAGSFDAAFELYLQAAQSYLFLIRHCHDGETKTRLRSVSGKLVERASRIKQAKKDRLRPIARDRFSIEEQALVLEGASTICGRRYPRWVGQNTTQSFSRTSNAGNDDQPMLSPSQLALGGNWQRSEVAFSQASMISQDISGRHIVQDNVADCSLVAALIVGAEHHAKFGSRLGFSCLFPQDDAGLPMRSETGVYEARFMVNGAWRRICIDDKLPVSGGRPMCATTSTHDQLWPALVEKAYLTLMGGYDFEGSNSGNDLYALSGWIPEHIPLNAKFQSERTWSRIYDAFGTGRCVLTLGTGKSAVSSFGLHPLHSYAILDVRERGGRRELELLNPWRNTSVPSADWTVSLREALPETYSTKDSEPLPFVVDWESVSTYFESLHLNWDPEKFKHEASFHSAFASSANSIDRTHFRLRFDVPPLPKSEVWLLLCRHKGATNNQDECIGLQVVKTWTEETQRSASTQLESSTSLTDNSSFLLRFHTEEAVDLYDIFVSRRGVSETCSFSLRALSQEPLRLVEGPPTLPHTKSALGTWSGRSAGGNHTCATFLNNPQYRVTLTPDRTRPHLLSELSVTCQAETDLPVNVKLVRSRGDRVTDLDDREVVAGTSTYNYGIDTCLVNGLHPGSYTLVVSTFLPHQEGPFTLTVGSTLALEVTAIPPEGAGLFNRSAKGRWASLAEREAGDIDEPRFKLIVSKPVNLRIRLQTPDRPAPLALSIFESLSGGLPGRLVGSTVAFSDATCGVITPSIFLDPSESGYLVVPQTPSVPDEADLAFNLYLYADQPVVLSS